MSADRPIEFSDLGAENRAISSSHDNLSLSSSAKKIRLVYCGDGVVEECDEDEEEEQRLAKEELERKLEEERKLDLEAKNMTWMPWMGYMLGKTASKSLEACDYAGEKLAWWLGITKPKFLYEIEEYNRMKQEEEERAANEDGVEEIRIGGDNKLIDSPVKPHQRDGETRMVLVNESSSSSAEPNANLKLFQSDN